MQTQPTTEQLKNGITWNLLSAGLGTYRSTAKETCVILSLCRGVVCSMKSSQAKLVQSVEFSEFRCWSWNNLSISVEGYCYYCLHYYSIIIVCISIALLSRIGIDTQLGIPRGISSKWFLLVKLVAFFSLRKVPDSALVWMGLYQPYGYMCITCRSHISTSDSLSLNQINSGINRMHTTGDTFRIFFRSAVRWC